MTIDRMISTPSAMKTIWDVDIRLLGGVDPVFTALVLVFALRFCFWFPAITDS
jgi:hypothetical protein